MSATESQPSPQPSNHPGLVRRTLRRRWAGILAVWVLASLAIGTFAHENLRPSYRALCLLRVDPTPTDLYNVKPANEPIELFLQTQVQLITSPNVLTAAGTNPKASVLERIQKAGDVVQELRKAIKVSVIPGTYLIEVSMTSPDASEAATLVNAVVDAFMEANSEWADGMTRIQIRNLEAYNIELQNQIDELERKWKSLVAGGDVDVPGPGEPRKVEANNRGPGPDRNITMEEYRQVQRDLNQTQIDLVEAEAWLTAAKAAINKAAASPEDQARTDAQVKRRFALDPEVADMAAKMKDARSNLDAASRQAADMAVDPAVKAARRKLDSLGEQWNRLWEVKSAAIREQIERGDGDKGMNPGREAVEAATRVGKLRFKQVSLKRQFDQLEVKNKRQATDAVEIALIQDERQTIKDMQVAVIRRLEQLRYEAKGEARIRPVNASGAMVPGRPISDPRPVLVAIPFVMLFVAFCLFIVVEAWLGPEVPPVAVDLPVRP